MNTKTIFLALLGTILLIVVYLPASYLVSQFIAQKNKRVMLVVAKHDYPKGTTITDPDEMFELQEIFESDAPRGIIFDLKDLKGMSLTSNIREGQPLQRGFLETTKDEFMKLLDDPSGPGRKNLLIMAKAREDSIRVGTRVDVIQGKAKENPNAEPIVLHDVLVRGVKPAKLGQKMLEMEGKTDLVAIYVVIDVGPPEESKLEASVKEFKNSFFELRPRGENKNLDKKNIPKGQRNIENPQKRNGVK